MKIISFAWTTEALLAGAKSCTRREWTSAYARMFRAGELLAAYDRLPRVHGKQVGVIRLTADPEWSNEYPESDYGAEGLAWMERQGQLIQGMQPRQWWREWVEEKQWYWIVRFTLEPVEAVSGA